MNQNQIFHHLYTINIDMFFLKIGRLTELKRSLFSDSMRMGESYWCMTKIKTF
jgi:hypothetical protein